MPSFAGGREGAKGAISIGQIFQVLDQELINSSPALVTQIFQRTNWSSCFRIFGYFWPQLVLRIPSTRLRPVSPSWNHANRWEDPVIQQLVKLKIAEVLWEREKDIKEPEPDWSSLRSRNRWWMSSGCNRPVCCTLKRRLLWWSVSRCALQA